MHSPKNWGFWQFAARHFDSTCLMCYDSLYSFSFEFPHKCTVKVVESEIVMQVNGIHGSQGVSPTNRVESAKATQSTAITNPTDQVEISPEAEIASQAADLVSQIHELPEIRLDRVDQIREAIDSGTYETEEKINIAVDRLLDEIG